MFLGADLIRPSLDSWCWYQRFAVPLISSRFFPDWEDERHPELREFAVERIRDCLERYWRGAGTPAVWGWKYCESLFAIPIIKRRFPSARFIHIIRDARDVCMSRMGFFQLTGDDRDPAGWDPPVVDGRRPGYREFCLRVTFGTPTNGEWHGLSLNDREMLVANRFLIQAQAWITCLSRAREYGRALGGDYYEIGYEDLCRDPRSEAARLFAWIGVPLRPEAVDSLRNVSISRVGVWQNERLTAGERRDFGNAVDLARELLLELGYEAS